MAVAGMRCAVVFAEATAADYGGDPGVITLVGYSGGGNGALLAAMSDIDPPDTCAVPGPVVGPQAVVAVDSGPLLGDPGFDQVFADDPETFYSWTPWRDLDPTDGFAVYLLAYDTNVGTQRSVDSRLYEAFANRHIDIDVVAELDEMGAFDDGTISSRETKQWAYQTVRDAGYDATFVVLPDSAHTTGSHWGMSDQAWEEAIDIIVDAAGPKS